MKNMIKALAVISMLSMTCAVMAGDATTKPAGLRGKVERVEGMTITITSKRVETVVETNANTTFMLDGQPATLADVKAGEKLTATLASGVASEVQLTTTKKKHKEPTTAPTAN